MFEAHPRSTTLENFLTTSAYNALVEEHLLELARKFLASDEVNQRLLNEHAQVGEAFERELNTEGATLSEMLHHAAPTGLELIRLDKVGSIRVSATKAEPFLRALLVRAARESARKQFLGAAGKSTTRKVLVGSLEQSGLSDAAQSEAEASAIDFDDPEISAHNSSFGIFGLSTLPDLAATYGFAPGDDDQRLDRARRATEARDRLLAALRDCDERHERWDEEDAALAKKIDKLIARRFAAPANDSDELTVAVYDGVARAFASIGEKKKKKALHQAYADKIMELAGLGAVRNADRTYGERVRKAQQRASKKRRSSK